MVGRVLFARRQTSSFFRVKLASLRRYTCHHLPSDILLYISERRSYSRRQTEKRAAKKRRDKTDATQLLKETAQPSKRGWMRPTKKVFKKESEPSIHAFLLLFAFFASLCASVCVSRSFQQMQPKQAKRVGALPLPSSAFWLSSHRLPINHLHFFTSLQAHFV